MYIYIIIIPYIVHTLYTYNTVPYTLYTLPILPGTLLYLYSILNGVVGFFELIQYILYIYSPGYLTYRYLVICFILFILIPGTLL